MPWRVETVTRLVHVGGPDNTIGKIHLEDGTTLICTDDWPHYPNCAVKLHPDFLPAEIATLFDETYEVFIAQAVERMRAPMSANDYKGKSAYPSEYEYAKTLVNRENISASVTSPLVEGHPIVIIEIGYVYGKRFERKHVYCSPIVRLEGSNN